MVISMVISTPLELENQEDKTERLKQLYGAESKEAKIPQKLLMTLGFKALLNRKKQKKAIACLKMLFRWDKDKDYPKRIILFEVKDNYEDPYTMGLTAQVSLVDLKRFVDEAEKIKPIHKQKWTWDRKKKKKVKIKSKVKLFNCDLWRKWMKK